MCIRGVGKLSRVFGSFPRCREIIPGALEASLGVGKSSRAVGKLPKASGDDPRLGKLAERDRRPFRGLYFLMVTPTWGSRPRLQTFAPSGLAQPLIGGIGARPESLVSIPAGGQTRMARDPLLSCCHR
jgi:hypothetical protein